VGRELFVRCIDGLCAGDFTQRASRNKWENYFMTYFDVRKMPPGTSDCIATRSINLMCALLKGIDYRTLYAKPFYDSSGASALDGIIRNINALDPALQVGATTNTPIVIDKLAGTNGAFVQIKKSLSAEGAPPITLGELFHMPRVANPSDDVNKLKNLIVDTLDGVHTASNDQMYHFCVPFLAIQLTRLPSGKRGPTDTEFGDFIDVLGGKTMQQFYDTPYTPGERTAAIKARRLCILKEKRPDGSKPPETALDGQGGNSRKCQNNTCVTSSNPEDWCSVVTFSDGSTGCALGSD